MKRQTTSRGKVLVLRTSDPISAETEEIQSRIRQRAYEISQDRGHSGREMDDWLSAESEIMMTPPSALIEKNGSFEVRMAAPGIDVDDLNVMATSDQMLVKCELRDTHVDDADRVHICDFKQATLFRSFRFPESVDLRSLKVESQDGILRISASKQKKASPSRKRSPARNPAPARGKRGAA